LSDGVMVAQGPLEAFVMVRIHVGQPTLNLRSSPNPLRSNSSNKRSRRHSHPAMDISF
jgi:hypothetical protein